MERDRDLKRNRDVQRKYCIPAMRSRIAPGIRCIFTYEGNKHDFSIYFKDILHCRAFQDANSAHTKSTYVDKFFIIHFNLSIAKREEEINRGRKTDTYARYQSPLILEGESDLF